MQAIHVYEAEDVDELALEIGDVVGVIPFPDPEDQVCLYFIACTVCVFFLSLICSSLLHIIRFRWNI